MKAPQVSVIISNYNSSDLLNDALESVVSTEGVTFDVLVIDDASTDGAFALVDERFKKDVRITFLQNKKNVGFSALNVALEMCQGTYLMMLDADARVAPATLSTLVGYMDAHPEAGAATANLHNPDGSIQNYYRRHMTPMRGFYTTVLGRFIDKYFLELRHFKSYHYDDLDTTRDFVIEQSATACLMLRREALGARILDPDFHVFIDVDLCRRIYDKGYKIYLVSEAYATHIKSVSFGKRESSWRRREFYRTLMLYFRKHYPASVPLMWVVLWLDRGMRFCLRHVIGHEPIR